MIDLPALAHRNGLPCDEAGLAIPLGSGRIVAWGDAELAYTTADGDELAAKLILASIGPRIVCRGNSLTMTFTPDKLPAVARMARDCGTLAI